FGKEGATSTDRGNSWVRNSLRKPLRLGLVRKVGPGLYAAAWSRKARPPQRSAIRVPSSPDVIVSADMLRNLQRMNPWWEGEPTLPTSETRRHLVSQIHRRLEAALASIIVVRGPRQIGKSTAQLQVIDDLLRRGVPPRYIFRVQFDDL